MINALNVFIANISFFTPPFMAETTRHIVLGLSLETHFQIAHASPQFRTFHLLNFLLDANVHVRRDSGLKPGSSPSILLRLERRS